MRVVAHFEELVTGASNTIIKNWGVPSTKSPSCRKRSMQREMRNEIVNVEARALIHRKDRVNQEENGAPPF